MKKHWRIILISKRNFLLFGLLFLLIIHSLNATKYNKIDNFVNFIKNSNCLQIKFNQSNYNYFGNEKIKFAGYLWYKPEKNFRIEYLKPEKEIIITNDKGFRDYTAIDDEVMKGKLTDIVFISPFSLLYNIDTYFDVSKKEDSFELISKNTDTGDVKKLSLEFKDKIYPSRMIVNMHSGSIVVYNFEYFRNVKYEPKLFNFDNLKTFYSKE